MKKTRKYSILLFLALALVLSACAGGPAASSWPGLTVEGDTAYLANNQHVYAINLTNGTERWRFPLEPERNVSFYAPPALTEDGQLLAGTYTGKLYSLNPETGQQNGNGWPVQVKSTEHFVAAPLATAVGVFASANNTLLALNPDGQQRWSYGTEHAQWATPATDGEKLYLASMDHYLYALDPDSGDVIWKSDDLGGALVGTPTLGEDGRLYIGTFGKQMLAIDANTGKVVGQPYTTRGWVWSGPALHEGKLYFGDLDGNIYALNAADLSEVWAPLRPDDTATRAISGQPLVTETGVYYTSSSGVLYGVNPENGTLFLTKPVGGKLQSGPVAYGDSLLVALTGADQILIALDKNGQQQWVFPPPQQ